jgi:DeoR/GlpR family transcriptional regulator of sugar metabolism
MENVTNNHNSIYEKVKAAYNNDKEFNRSKLADLLSVSRMTIARYVNELKK